MVLDKYMVKNKQNAKRNYISIQELKAPWESLEASI